MTTFNKIKSDRKRIKDLEKGRKYRLFDEYDPEDRPAAVEGLVLDFHVREKRSDIRYDAVATWDPLSDNTCAADIDQYDIEIWPCTQNGNVIEEGRKDQKHFIVKDPDDLETETLKMVFKDVEHPKRWFWKARARIIDVTQQRGEWSDFTDPVLPFTTANPEPPAPEAVFLDFDKNEKDRHEPRYRALVRFNEINFFDVPPTAPREKFTTTLDGDLAAGANEVKVNDLPPQPQPGERISVAIRPNKVEIEIISYSDRNVVDKKLLDVRRGLEGTTDKSHTSGDSVKLSAEDQQDRQNDLESYITQIRRCTEAGVFIKDTKDKYIQRTKPHPWRSEDDDNDGVVQVVFPNIRKRHFWKARARTKDRFNRRGPWTEWTVVGSPSDVDPPPPATDVLVDVDNKKIHISCEIPDDPDNENQPHPDISHLQYYVYDNADFSGNPIRKDKYVVGTKKTFEIKKPQNNYWARVRTVDGSGNVSNYSSNVGQKQVPPTPNNTPSISFSKGGKKGIRATLSVQYPNFASYNEDFIVAVQFAFQNEDTSPTNSDTVRRKSDHVSEDETGPCVAVFEKIRQDERCRASYRVKDRRGHFSQWSAWSSVQVASVGRAPGKPTSIKVIPKPRAVVAKWVWPIVWNDGSAVGFSKSEVAYFVATLKRNGVVQTDPDGSPIVITTKANRAAFPMTKAEANLTGYYVDVESLGWDDSTSGSQVADNTADPTDITMVPQPDHKHTKNHNHPHNTGHGHNGQGHGHGHRKKKWQPGGHGHTLFYQPSHNEAGGHGHQFNPHSDHQHGQQSAGGHGHGGSTGSASGHSHSISIASDHNHGSTLGAGNHNHGFNTNEGHSHTHTPSPNPLGAPDSGSNIDEGDTTDPTAPIIDPNSPGNTDYDPLDTGLQGFHSHDMT